MPLGLRGSSRFRHGSTGRLRGLRTGELDGHAHALPFGEIQTLSKGLVARSGHHEGVSSRIDFNLGVDDLGGTAVHSSFDSSCIRGKRHANLRYTRSDLRQRIVGKT